MNKPAESPRIVLIAGPKGAGKASFTQEYLPQEAGFPDFIDLKSRNR
jgi:tRNA A37 threonylcarbamoyladenosine biosynthesis protein TsaE